MDEMSEKFLNQFGVKDLGDIMENGNDGNEFLGRITSCNKVSEYLNLLSVLNQLYKKASLIGAISTGVLPSVFPSLFLALNGGPQNQNAA